MNVHMITVQKRFTEFQSERKFVFSTREELEKFRSYARNNGWSTLRMTQHEGFPFTTSAEAMEAISQIDDELLTSLPSGL